MNIKVKVQKLPQAFDLSCGACIGTYSSHSPLPRAEKRQRKKVMCLSEHLLEVYSVHGHGGSELQETETRNKTNQRSPDH